MKKRTTGHTAGARTGTRVTRPRPWLGRELYSPHWPSAARSGHSRLDCLCAGQRGPESSRLWLQLSPGGVGTGNKEPLFTSACWGPHQETCPWPPGWKLDLPSSERCQVFSVGRVAAPGPLIWQAAACGEGNGGHAGLNSIPPKLHPRGTSEGDFIWRYGLCRWVWRCDRPGFRTSPDGRTDTPLLKFWTNPWLHTASLSLPPQSGSTPCFLTHRRL